MLWIKTFVNISDESRTVHIHYLYIRHVTEGMLIITYYYIILLILF